MKRRFATEGVLGTGLVDLVPTFDGVLAASYDRALLCLNVWADNWISLTNATRIPILLSSAEYKKVIIFVTQF